MPIWSVDPTIQSSLFNVNGIAHKMVFDTDVSYAQATTNLTNLPLYDQIDDNDIEAYRRWFAFTDFGGPPPVPPQFDERFYALRRGLGNWVASPSTEIADDLFAARLGLRQRWQTKRGPIGNQRIVDWIVLNTDVTIFPNASRDNFGQTFGLVDYDFRWHVGDRTTVVSDGYFDFFTNAPQYVTIGTFLNRPPRGSIYLGFRSLEGPITSNVVATRYSYRMSPKWMSTFGTTFDVAQRPQHRPELHDHADRRVVPDDVQRERRHEQGQRRRHDRHPAPLPARPHRPAHRRHVRAHGRRVWIGVVMQTHRPTHG